MAWVNQSTPSTAAWVAGFGAVTIPDVGWSGYYYLQFYSSRDDIAFYVPPNAPVVDYILSSSPVGNWHMAAATYDPNAKTAILYWDGQPVGTANNIAATPANGQFSIGAIGPPCSGAVIFCQNFTGAIDEVAVWNYPLAAAQVSQIYGSAACPTPVPDNETVQVTDTGSLMLSLIVTDNETVHVIEGANIPILCSITQDQVAGIADVQAIINQALGLAPPANDLNGDRFVGVADIQTVINAALGMGCLIG